MKRYVKARRLTREHSYSRKEAPVTLDPRNNNFIHSLEPRKLLAATLDNGTLNVTGTAANDAITVWISSPTQISVKINKTAIVFNLSQVNAIFIRGFTGDDTIALPTIVAPINIKTTIYGDGGNDMIFGAVRGANVNGHATLHGIIRD